MNECQHLDEGTKFQILIYFILACYIRQLHEATELYLMLKLPFLRLFFSIHVSSGRCISSLNKWTDSLAGKSCILWLTYEELSQVVGASFVSELLGDLRTLQHAVPEIAIAQKEHQQATDFWLIKKNTKKWVVIECTLNQLEHQGKRKVSPRHALLTPDLQHPLGEHAKLGQLAAAWFQPPSWQHLWGKPTEGWARKSR